MRIIRGVLAAGVLLAAGVAFAHETWVRPHAGVVRVGEEAVFDLTSGMEFPRLGSAIQPDRVAKGAWSLNGSESPLPAGVAGSESLVFKQAFTSPGLATLWMDLKPRDIELTDAQVEEYLAEVGASKEVRTAWEAQKGHWPWKEIYTKHAKAFVAVGEAPGDRSWQEPVGMKLEIVPGADPRSLKLGQELKVRLLWDGKPLAGAALAFVGVGVRKLQTTDAAGEAAFRDYGPGAAMIHVVRLLPGSADRPWESHFSSLTLNIGESQ